MVWNVPTSLPGAQCTERMGSTGISGQCTCRTSNASSIRKARRRPARPAPRLIRPKDPFQKMGWLGAMRTTRAGASSSWGSGRSSMRQVTMVTAWPRERASAAK